LTVQGKGLDEFIEFYLEPKILGTFTHSYQVVHVDPTGRIGIYESGKGDYFGPLCIAGVYAEGADISKLHALGLKDSKKMTDKAILKAAKEIRRDFAHHIVKINPAKYNELYTQFKNLNKLLAWGHATTIEQLVAKTDCHTVIIDQFADEHVVLTALKRKKMKIDLTQRHRAEEDIVVAAASILARETFLLGLDELSERYQMTLPKGASKAVIEAAKGFVRNQGKDNLGNVAKLHFKTTLLV
jgi:ribonuclease HIII